jgi:5-methylcytosine-specific restriction endonuclease McrA
MTEKRKQLTRREFGLLIIKQDGLCGCGCKRRLDFTRPKLVTDEHLVPLFSQGANDLENRQLWLTECSTAKTSKEAPDRAKVRRIEGGKTQADKRAQRGPTIRGRGFQGSRKFNGEIKWKRS